MILLSSPTLTQAPGYGVLSQANQDWLWSSNIWLRESDHLGTSYSIVQVNCSHHALYDGLILNSVSSITHSITTYSEHFTVKRPATIYLLVHNLILPNELF